MDIQISLDDDLVHGRTRRDMQKAVKEAVVVQEFVNGNIALKELAKHFEKDHIDMIVWLKENGFNPPSIQGYTENGFTKYFQGRIDIANRKRKSRSLMEFDEFTYEPKAMINKS